MASSGESGSDLYYAEVCKNLPTILANTPELEGHIQELQQMRDVAEDELDGITQPTELFIHPEKLIHMFISNNKKIPVKNQQYNGNLLTHSTQPSSLYSSLTDSSVVMNEPPLRPRIIPMIPPAY